MGALPQDLKIIFEMKRRMSNEKLTRREISFSTYKTRFFSFFFSLFEPFLISNHITFLFLIHFKRFKML
jgi:hypothetical protein